MTQSITFVIFDMDGVLYDKDDSVRLRALSDLSGKPEAEVDATIYRSDFEPTAEIGDPATGEAYLARFGAWLGTPIDQETWTAIRKDMMRPRPAVFAIARRVSVRAEIAMLTNNPILLKEVLPKCAPEAVALFGEAAHVSAEFGARKPDPALFRAVCERHGRKASESLMIDDSEKNVSGAIEAGLDAFRYEGPARLRSELAERGLLD